VGVGGADEPLSGSSEPLSHGFRRSSGHRGKLIGAEAVEVAEEQKRTVVGREMTLQQVAESKELEVIPLGSLGTLPQPL